MGKKINFKAIHNADGTIKFIGTDLVNVLNNITSDQFVKMVRRSVHFSIMPKEYEYIPMDLMRELKYEVFPKLTKSELVKIYHYWKIDTEDNVLAKTVESFEHIYHHQGVNIALLIGFEKKNNKLVAYSEWSCRYEDKEYSERTIMELIDKLHQAIRDDEDLYRKLKGKYEYELEQQQDNRRWKHSIKVADEFVEKLKKAPMTMEELERACELEPDGTFDDI